MRIGHGYDVHRLVEGRDLILGGVKIDYEKGLDGHSDADVLLHAVSDALLGAAGLGDIGRHFPDTDPQYKGADSLLLLKNVAEKVTAAGYRVSNIDVTMIAQRPKLKDFIPQMEENIALAVGIAPSRVNVKATTEEKLGFTGTGEGNEDHEQNRDYREDKDARDGQCQQRLVELIVQDGTKVVLSAFELLARGKDLLRDPVLLHVQPPCVDKSDDEENGQEAWDVIEAMQAKGDITKHLDCIITDIEMPLMDGHRLTKLVKSDAELRDIPVIIFSSLVNEEMRKKGEQLGADAQLTKPEIGKLVEAIDKLIDKA